MVLAVGSIGLVPQLYLYTARTSRTPWDTCAQLQTFGHFLPELKLKTQFVTPTALLQTSWGGGCACSEPHNSGIWRMNLFAPRSLARTLNTKRPNPTDTHLTAGFVLLQIPMRGAQHEPHRVPLRSLRTRRRVLFHGFTSQAHMLFGLYAAVLESDEQAVAFGFTSGRPYPESFK